MRCHSCLKSKRSLERTSACHPEPAEAGKGSAFSSHEPLLTSQCLFRRPVSPNPKLDAPSPSLPRSLNPQLPQLLLQTLPMQTHLSRRLRHIPMMLFQFPPQINNLKLPLGLAKIRFSQKRIIPRFLRSASRRSSTTIFANLLRQVRRSNFIAIAQHQ